MKWNIDAEIVKLEPDEAAGTQINRCLCAVDVMRREGVKPTPAQIERGHGNIWVVGLGFIQQPKAFFYGQTIREAYLKARRAAKADKLAKHTPWGSQPFNLRQKKKAEKERVRSEQRAAKRKAMGITINVEPDGSTTATHGNLTVTLPPVVADALREMSEDEASESNREIIRKTERD